MKIDREAEKRRINSYLNADKIRMVSSVRNEEESTERKNGREQSENVRQQKKNDCVSDCRHFQMSHQMFPDANSSLLK